MAEQAARRPGANPVPHAVLDAFEAAFPGRVRACYLLGSYGDGTALATSDLDLTVVFRDRFLDKAEREAAERVAASLCARTAVELDVEVTDEAELEFGASPTFKLGSELIHGADLRDRVPLMPLDVWTRDRMHTSYWRIITLFGRPVPVTIPLDYPVPADQFFGYARRRTRLPDGSEAPGTRDLIRSVGWAATALLAVQTGAYVARKRDCHVLYRQRIGDEWSDLLEDLYVRCRGEWAYLIPTDPDDQLALRALCARTLGFENHFLAVYRRFLLRELTGDAAARVQALDALARLPLDDPAVAAMRSSAPSTPPATA